MAKTIYEIIKIKLGNCCWVKDKQNHRFIPFNSIQNTLNQ